MNTIGIKSFKIVLVEIVEFDAMFKEQLQMREDHYIKQFDAVRNGLNSKYGGPWPRGCKPEDGGRCKQKIKLQHTTPPADCKYKCEQCNKTYCSKSSLNRHNKSKH
jgi:hypothetical protein